MFGDGVIEMSLPLLWKRRKHAVNEFQVFFTTISVHSGALN